MLSVSGGFNYGIPQIVEAAFGDGVVVVYQNTLHSSPAVRAIVRRVPQIQSLQQCILVGSE